MTIIPICPLIGSGTGILNVIDVEMALFHSPSSPALSTLVCSVNFAFAAIGAFDASCATSAARYASAVEIRHARSQDARTLWAVATDAVIVTPTSAARRFFMRVS